MEELWIELLLVMEHAPDRMEHPAHDGDDRNLLLFAAGEERLIVGTDLGAALDGYQGRHEEGEAQMPVAGAADMEFRGLNERATPVAAWARKSDSKMAQEGGAPSLSKRARNRPQKRRSN